MNFRTIVDIEASPDKITYKDKTMFAGSCFATSMGELMRMGKMDVMINPAGTVYNPVSVANTIDSLISERIFVRDDLYNHKGSWLSFSHDTDFSSDDPDSLLAKINSNIVTASEFLSKSRFLFITLGTARIYRLKKTGIIVSNCHKLPSDNFENELLTVKGIVEHWESFLDRLLAFNPQLRVVFTISPVRHWKDGAHGNQVSKSVLFLAVEELLMHNNLHHYFPAYELLMDDLRDYRFYSDDMLHPSSSAVNYIWDKFSGTYFDTETVNLRSEILKIFKAFNHRFLSDSQIGKREFADKMLRKISEIELRNTSLDFSSERDYFRGLLE